MGHGRQEHPKADKAHDASPEGTVLVMHSASFRVEVASRPMAEGHYTWSSTGDKRVEAGTLGRETDPVGGAPSLSLAQGRLTSHPLPRSWAASTLVPAVRVSPRRWKR